MLKQITLNNHKVEIEDEGVNSFLTVDGRVHLVNNTTVGIFGYLYTEEDVQTVQKTFPNLKITELAGCWHVSQPK